MSTFYLAQINIARMRAPADAPIMQEFMDNLDKINALAEAAPGFVWRLQGEAGNATNMRPYEDERMIVNMSAWESIETFKEYTYKSHHKEFLRRGLEWFEKSSKPRLALWWVEVGTRPSIEEGVARITYLQDHGDSEYAFSFRQLFEPSE